MPFIPDTPDSAKIVTGPTPGFVADSPESTDHNPVWNVLKGGSDLARNVGLGAIPDTLGTLGGIANKVSTGSPNFQDNPFMSEERAHQIGQQGPWTTAVKDSAGLTGWSMGMESPTLAGQLLKGGVTGGLLGASSDNATPGSVGTSAAVTAAINALLPGLGNVAEKGLGRLALGSGGEALPELIGETGNKISGSGPELQHGLYDMTEPIRTKLNQLLADSEGRIKPSEIFGSLDKNGSKAENGILDTLVSKVGPSQGVAAKDYVETLKNYFADKVLQYYKDTTGAAPSLDKLQGNTPLPLDFWNDFMHGVGKDVGNAWDKESSPTQKAMAKQLWGWLRSNIAERSGNPEDVNALTKLSKSALDITNNLKNKESGNTAVGLLKQFGIPAEIIGSLLTGHPEAAAVGAATGALRNPKVATGIINGLESGGTEAITSLLGKLGGKGAANLVTPRK